MLYINGRFLTQPMTGVNRYAYNVCKSMAALGQPFTLVCPKADFHDSYDVRGLNIVHFGFGNSHFWEQLVLPLFFVGKRDYMLLCFTGLGPILIRRKIMTVHDLAFIENPAWYTRAYHILYKFLTPLSVKTSRHIITVSEFSKSEILRFYPFMKPSQISVVYGAVDKKILSHPGCEETTAAEPFALTVSSIDPRKNFSRLIEAFKDIPEAKLYIVGSYNRVFSEKNNIAGSTENIKFLGRVNDDELIRLYQTASCFIFPSIYEGFGLPPLEAMACGCPVLASDIPVEREVCGDAALYFNPYDVQSIRKTFLDFLGRIDELKPLLQAKGAERHRRFSFEESAKKIIRLAERCQQE